METKLKDDFEENDYAGDTNTVKFLEDRQRELVTSTIDYNLESISELINKRTINLEAKYQRRYRWDNKRKSRLIESFLMNIPVPPIFLNEDNFGEYSVIDGKQRLSSITEFLNGELKLNGLEIFENLNGLNYYDLPKEFQNSIKIRANIRAIILLRQSDKDIKYEVFHRLNTGGVSLNAQEIRNNAFSGKLNDKLVDLSQNKTFISMLGIKSKQKSKLYQEMKDVELVLRFFALKDNWREYSGGLKYILDSYMDVNTKMSDNDIEMNSKHFIDTIVKVESVFGAIGSFRRWLPEPKKWKQQISAPIFDAQMLACYNLNSQKLKDNKNNILKNFKALFQKDKEFVDSIESSTASPSRFLYRTHKLREIIS